MDPADIAKQYFQLHQEALGQDVSTTLGSLESVRQDGASDQVSTRLQKVRASILDAHQTFLDNGSTHTTTLYGNLRNQMAQIPAKPGLRMTAFRNAPHVRSQIRYLVVCNQLQTPRRGGTVFEDVGFTVATGEAKANAPDGFVLEPDEAKQLLKKLQGIQAQLQKARENARLFARLKSPSQDPSTLAAHEAAIGGSTGKQGALSASAGHIDLQLDYVTELTQRIEAALGMTKASDHRQSSLINSVNTQEKTE